MLDPAVRAHVAASSEPIDEIFERFGLPGPPVACVVAHDVPVRGGSILVRSYHPHGSAGLPVHVYLHGGGWTGGSVAERVCDATARHRSVEARCVTVTVEYRLAPQHQFPTAVEDVVEAVHWIRGNATLLDVDPGWITMGGSSAGANLAAAAQLADPSLGIRALLLEVPALDLRDGGSLPLPADIHPDDAHWIDPMQAEYASAVAAYLPHPDLGTSPLATPLVADDVSAFPETFIFTAELDVLRPGAEAFAEKLLAAGVPTHLTCYPGALHGSPILNATWATARRWHDDSLAILRRLNERGSDEAA